MNIISFEKSCFQCCCNCKILILTFCFRIGHHRSLHAYKPDLFYLVVQMMNQFLESSEQILFCQKISSNSAVEPATGPTPDKAKPRQALQNGCATLPCERAGQIRYKLYTGSSATSF